MGASEAETGGDESRLGFSEDRQQWEALSHDEQADILTNEMQARTGSASHTGASASTSTDGGNTNANAGFGSDAAGFRALMQDGWTAHYRGVEVNFETISEEWSDEILDQVSGVLDADLSDVETEEDLDDVEGVEDINQDFLAKLLGNDEEFEEWLCGMLAELTTDDEMDFEFWHGGESVPAGAKAVLFIECMEESISAFETIDGFR